MLFVESRDKIHELAPLTRPHHVSPAVRLTPLTSCSDRHRSVRQRFGQSGRQVGRVRTCALMMQLFRCRTDLAVVDSTGSAVPMVTQNRVQEWDKTRMSPIILRAQTRQRREGIMFFSLFAVFTASRRNVTFWPRCTALHRDCSQNQTKLTRCGSNTVVALGVCSVCQKKKYVAVSGTPATFNLRQAKQRWIRPCAVKRRTAVHT